MKTNNEVDGQHLACHEPMRFGGKRPVGLQENMDDDDTEPRPGIVAGQGRRRIKRSLACNEQCRIGPVNIIITKLQAGDLGWGGGG